jgi:hypothetical protein
MQANMMCMQATSYACMQPPLLPLLYACSYMHRNEVGSKGGMHIKEEFSTCKQLQ